MAEENAMEEKSLVLCKILEDIGLSTRFRKRCYDLVEMKEMAQKILFYTTNLYPQVSIEAGSFVEGTFRNSLNSDLDTLVIFRSYMAAEEGTHEQNKTHFRILSDTQTFPGYVKLVLKGLRTDLEHVPFPLEKSSDGYLLLVNKVIEKFAKVYVGQNIFKQSGPAITYSTSDMVYGFKCSSWPTMAEEWFRRSRRYNWPTQETMALLRNTSCFVVPVGSKSSRQRKFEWRLSFNLQERYLMVNLNETQFKCYMLLKYIKESYITPQVGKSLTSYHCKTSLFYTMEENKWEIWTPKLLIECFIKCIQKILQWCETNFCPNYFIPNCNLFLGKVQGEKMIKLKSFIKEIASRPLYFIQRIDCDKIGLLLTLDQTHPDFLKVQKEIQNDTAAFMILRLLSAAEDISECARRLLERTYPYLPFTKIMSLAASGGSDISVMLNIIPHLLVLKDIYKFLPSCKTSENKKVTLEFIVSLLATSLASHYAVIAVTRRSHRDACIYMSAYYFWTAMLFESRISRLKLANALHIMGHTESARRILRETDKAINDIRYFLGAEKVMLLGTHITDLSYDDICDISVRELLVKYICGPIVFLPAEFTITSDCLKFEMFRSFATPYMCGFENIRYWYIWAVVDVKTFYHFLKWETGCYTSFSEFCRNVSIAPYSQMHTETLMNIVGWISKKKGLAAQAFFHSWFIFKMVLTKRGKKYVTHDTNYHHNAAKLHMALLSFEQWKSPTCDV